MRFSPPATALCLSLLPVVGFAVESPASRGGSPVLATEAAPPAVDAAAKHAKRTACLKNAKGEKLVGAEKTSFIKRCIEVP